MKNYSLVPQEKKDYCLCSVVQAILRVHQINFSQAEIASNLTQSEAGFRIYDKSFFSFMKTNGFDYQHFWYDMTPFNEPDMLLEEMNNNEGIIGVRNHVFLLQDFADPLLMLIDPKNSDVIEKDIYTLMREMAKTEGFFGLLKYIN